MQSRLLDTFLHHILCTHHIISDNDLWEIRNTPYNIPYISQNGYPAELDNLKLKDLRTLIPILVQHSTGNEVVTWQGQAPSWWPSDFLAWSDVRLDTRSSFMRKRMSMRCALQLAVKNCYEYHGCTDLLEACYSSKPPKTFDIEFYSKVTPDEDGNYKMSMDDVMLVVPATIRDKIKTVTIKGASTLFNVPRIYTTNLTELKETDLGNDVVNIKLKNHCDDVITLSNDDTPVIK